MSTTMYDDIDNERDFWRDEPTRGLSRTPARPRTRQHIPVITTPARAGRRPIDPFVVRLGLMLCFGIAVGLVALTLRHGASDVLRTAPIGGATAVPTAGTAATTSSALPLAQNGTDPGLLIVPASDEIAELEVAPASAGAATTEFDIDALPEATPVGTVPVTTVPLVAQEPPAQKSSSTPAVAVATTLPATTTTAATATMADAPKAEAPTTAPTCITSYKVVSGDYWILIAKKVSVSTKDLLAANNAKATTPLYPGRSICLPKNASAPTTPAAPSTTAPARTVTTTTKPAATTVAPATTVPRRSYSATEVEAIIREVWPDELEDEAVRIARRESNLQPTARNACCYGLFQIYWTVHKGWLVPMGITSAEQLFDPRVAATAGYALYQRSGGWGPWAL
jgi:LysM repeat protein